MASSPSYDCVVVGSGPGGYVAAIRAAQLSLRTAVVEKDRVGGRCLNYACIPAKAVLRSADVLTEIREAGEFGLKVAEPEIDYAAVSARREKVVSTLTKGVSGLFKKNGIEFVAGSAGFTPEGHLRIRGESEELELEARAIVLATGSVGATIPGTEFGPRVIGTEGAWALPEIPATMAVVGAGASGTEIASAYARLGSQVQLFEALDRVLPTEDADISRLAARGPRKASRSPSVISRASSTIWSWPRAAAPTSRAWASTAPGSSSMTRGWSASTAPCAPRGPGYGP